MKIRDVMATDVVAATPDMTYYEVAKLMYDHQVSGVPVVEHDKVVGIVSEKDLYRILYPFYSSFYEHPEMYVDLEARESKAQEIKEHKVRTFMKTKVDMVHPEDPIMRAGALMLAHNDQRLPVVDQGKLVGIVDRRDIYRAIIKKNFGF